jgi:Haem-NO-binding
MHHLVNKAFQSFVRDTFGPATWVKVVRQAELRQDIFESLFDHDPATTAKVVGAAVRLLGRPREALFEDMGNYLVSHPNTEGLRRLLRFGGARFIDFLHSLDELPDRARLALPHLDLPPLELIEHTPDAFTLRFNTRIEGFGHMLVGLLRAMADDYGALVVLDHLGTGGSGERLRIQVLDQGHTEGRQFELARAGKVA